MSTGQVAYPKKCQLLEGATAYVGFDTCKEWYTNYFLCNGAADDVQIQAAVDYINALGGGIVSIENGTYEITVTITIPTFLTLDLGNALLQKGGNIPLITVSGNESRVLNGKIDGQSSSFTGAGIYITGNNNIVQNIEIEDVDTYGIYLDGANYNRISNCYLYTCKHGIHITNHSSYNEVDHCIAYLNDERGFSIYESRSNSITDCIGNINGLYNFLVQGTSGYSSERNLISSCLALGNSGANGIQAGIAIFSYSNRNKVSGCFAFYNWDNGIEIYVSPSDNTTISQNTVEDCTCYKNGYAGIMLSKARYSIIEGNLCISNGAREGDPVANPHRASGISIIGVATYTSTRNFIEGNYCFDDGASDQVYGIYEGTNCDYNVISDNRLWLNVTGAIVITGANTAVPEIYVPIVDDSHAQASISNIGDYLSILMVNNQDCDVRFNFPIPDVFQEVVTAVIELVPTGANPTMRWTATTDWAECNEAYNAGGGSIGATETNMNQNQKECLDVSAGLTGIGARDTVGFTLSRNGAHANDDAGNVHLLGFRMRYI